RMPLRQEVRELAIHFDSSGLEHPKERSRYEYEKDSRPVSPYKINICFDETIVQTSWRCLIHAARFLRPAATMEQEKSWSSPAATLHPSLAYYFSSYAEAIHKKEERQSAAFFVVLS